MRKPLAPLVLTAACWGLLVPGSASAQQDRLNRVADGGFEGTGVSLSLPATTPFPMFSGGWASRGDGLPEVVENRSFRGAAALRLRTAPERPLQVLQDVPLTGPAFGMRFAFLIEGGEQTLRLLERWDRNAPSAGTPAFEARISAGGITFTTPAGTWRAEVAIGPDRWHALSVIADPRSGAQTVRLDGVALITLPGMPSRTPSTLILAGGDADAGSFVYDDIEVLSLVDLELATIRAAVGLLELATRDELLDRFAVAAVALERGSEALALPELRAARRLLAAREPATENLAQAVDELIDLVEASRDPAAARERSFPF
jgi:hypothetical protein